MPYFSFWPFFSLLKLVQCIYVSLFLHLCRKYSRVLIILSQYLFYTHSSYSHNTVIVTKRQYFPWHVGQRRLPWQLTISAVMASKVPISLTVCSRRDPSNIRLSAYICPYVVTYILGSSVGQSFNRVHCDEWTYLVGDNRCRSALEYYLYICSVLRVFSVRIYITNVGPSC